MFEKAFGEGTDVPSSVLALPSFSGSATAFAAAALARGERRARGARPTEEDSPFVLVVTPGIPEADTVADDLRVLEGESGVRSLAFPPPLEDDPASTAARLRVSAALGAWLDIDRGEWVAVVLCCALVISLECMNTAVEAVVDLASPDIHPLAKRAKDCAAGAVLISAVGAAVVGCVVFLPRLADMLKL